MSVAFPARTAMLLSLGLVALPVLGKSWDGNGNGVLWGDPVNWLGNTLPLAGETVNIGDLAGVADDNTRLDANFTIAGLNITDGMSVDTFGFTLLVNGDTTVSGTNGPGDASRLTVRRGNGVDDMDTNDLNVTSGATLSLFNRGIVEVDNVLTVSAQSTITGDGEINLNQGSGTVFNNNGVLNPSTGGGIEINVLGSGQIDLDGSSGTGDVFLNTALAGATNASYLEINGLALADAFDGEMSLFAGSIADMNLSNGWTLGSGGTLRFSGSSSVPGVGELRGGDVSIAGAVSVENAGGHGWIDADATTTPGANIDVQQDNRLTFAGASTTVSAGTFQLDPGAVIEFLGDTTMQNAVFNFTTSESGLVKFLGDTTYSFNTAITSGGVLQQTGDASIIGAMAVSGGVFDLDGGLGSTTITLGNVTNPGSMTLNVVAIDTLDNTFNGTLNTGDAGITGRLTINLPAGQAWTMAGTLNLTGTNNLFTPNRIAGSKMIVTGAINLVDGRPAGIGADVDVTAQATINTQGPTSRINVNAQTHIANGATFNGTGVLRNTGTLTLADGVDTAAVVLDNAGTLILGDSPGSASVGAFVQRANAQWQVEIGGDTPGGGFDRLNVAGEAALDGTLALSLINGFVPDPGESFTILTSTTRNGTTFERVTGARYIKDRVLVVTYTNSDVIVTEALLGDLDLDGDVDDADFGIAFANFTGPGGTGQNAIDGDLDGDGDVDDADFGLAFSAFTGPGGPANVPEPASLALFALGGLIASRRRRA